MNLKTSRSPSPTIPTQHISALLFLRLKHKPLLFRRKNVPNKGTSSTSTTSDPPTKEEPSPTRHRSQHSGAFANPRTLQSLVLISSPPTLITPTTTMIMLISYKLVFIITLLGYQKSVSFFVVTTRLIGFLSIQFALLLI